jgi:hypothetical protein
MRRPTRDSIAAVKTGEIQPDGARRTDDTRGELVSFVEAWVIQNGAEFKR